MRLSNKGNDNPEFAKVEAISKMPLSLRSIKMNTKRKSGNPPQSGSQIAREKIAMALS